MAFSSLGSFSLGSVWLTGRSSIIFILLQCMLDLLEDSAVVKLPLLFLLAVFMDALTSGV